MKLIHLQPFINIDSLNNVEILSANLSLAMQQKDKIILRTDEGFSFKENGLFSVLDNLCDYWGYDGNNITIETNNYKETHPVYQIKKSLFSSDFIFLEIPKMPVDWNKEKKYGMFISRASVERLYGIIKHRRSPHATTAMTSFNQPYDDLKYREIEHLIKNNNVTLDELNNVQLHSDVDYVHTNSITPPYSNSSKVWQQVYRKIGVEIVFETNQFETCLQITEKTLRPIAHKRPFIVVAPKGYLKELKNLGFKTYDNIIPNWYDNFSGLTRVDAVFDVLDQIINSNLIDSILIDCYNDIEHNYNRLIELQREHKAKQIEHVDYYDFSGKIF